MTDKDYLIRLTDVGMRWEHRTVLEGVDLTVRPGDFLAITGPNGGGKTTLLRIVLRLLRPTSGTVSYRLDGHSVDRLPIGYLPQKNAIDSRFPISAEQVVHSALLPLRGLPRDERRSRVAEALRAVDMEAHASRPIGVLSGGQLQRVLLARAIVSRPRLLVLDEPLSYIDKRFEAHLYGLIERLAASTTILLVSHEMTTIASMANRHLIVDRTLHECAASHHFVPTACD